MKYINSIVRCYKNLYTDALGRVCYSADLDKVKAKKIDGKYVIEGFYIVSEINVRGSGDKAKSADSPLDQEKTLYFLLRLTKLDPDPKKQLSYDLKSFTMDLSDRSRGFYKACFDYIEKTEITKVSKTALESPGKYVIKLLVKDKVDDDSYDIHLLHQIEIV